MLLKKSKVRVGRIVATRPLENLAVVFQRRESNVACLDPGTNDLSENYKTPKCMYKRSECPLIYTCQRVNRKSTPHYKYAASKITA